MTKDEKSRRVCANEGCERAAPAGEPFCETCAIEWALYRRDEREKGWSDRPALAAAEAIPSSASEGGL